MFSAYSSKIISFWVDLPVLEDHSHTSHGFSAIKTSTSNKKKRKIQPIKSHLAARLGLLLRHQFLLFRH
jgi:hypothetical protein